MACAPVLHRLTTAVALERSPGLWRASYGPARLEELMALERTILILAQEINSAYGRDDAALRMVMDTLASGWPVTRTCH